ncbi:MAG: cation:proton antiporter [Bdellovibrionales bacterium]|nr:cation:proton antiporter [Bdellovibrionales bacterium]
MEIIIIGLAVLFFLGHALNWFFIKTKIPDLLILVILGYTLGPILGVINPSDLGKVGSILSTTALIVILYEGGIHLSAKDLLTSSLPALLLSLVGFGLIAIVGGLVAYLIGMQSIVVAALLGVGIGSTSSAIVIPMVKPLSIADKSKTVLSLESAFTDVLAIVIFLGLVESAASGNYNAGMLILGIGSKPIISLAIGLGSGLLWAFIKKRFAPLVSMAFAGEAWALLTYGAIELVNMNGAIGVLALGFALANLDLLPKFLRTQISAIPVSYNDMSLLSEITFLLRTFFFMYLGLLIQFSNLQIVLMAILLTVLIFATRYLAIRLLFSPKHYQRLDAMVSVAMGPRGLACAVLATVPLQKGIAGGEWIQQVVFALIPMSIFLTALFVSFSENEKMRSSMAKLFLMYPEKKKELPHEPIAPH